MHPESIQDFVHGDVFGFPEDGCVFLHGVFGERTEIAFTVISDDIEDTGNDVITDVAVTLQGDQLTFFIADEANTGFGVEDLNQAFAACANADSLLQGIQFVFEQGRHRSIAGCYH